MVIQVQLGNGSGGPGGPPSWLVYIPGAILISLGLMVVFAPQIIQMLLAGVLIFGGILMILAPRSIRRMGGFPKGGFGGKNPFSGFGPPPQP